MRYVDLITNPLNEAQLSPGEVREIKLKISEYENKLAELKQKEIRLRNDFEYDADDYPKEIHDKVQAYINAYTKQIAILKDQLRKDYPEDSFNNFIAGIKKNCSEILEIYRQRRSFLYAGFEKTGTALYAKPPEEAVIPKYYEDRRFDILAEMIETFTPFNFKNSILANGDPYSNIIGTKQAFVIFPRNGFKYFYSPKLENFMLSDTRVASMFNKEIALKAYDYFVGNPEMREKFKSAGGYTYDWSKEYVLTADGFMGSYSWDNNTSAITRMAEDGIIDEKWGQLAYIKNWVTQETFNAATNFQTTDLGTAMRNYYDIVLNTTGVYAVHTRFQSKLYNALEVRDY